MKKVSLTDLYDDLSTQSIVYPFMDELEELANYEKAIRYGQTPDDSAAKEYANYTAAMNDGAHMFVATAINVGQVLEKYAANIGTHVLPPVQIYLHAIQPGDDKIIADFGRTMNKSENGYPNTNLEIMKYTNIILSAHKIGQLLTKGTDQIYYSVTDHRLAQALAGKGYVPPGTGFETQRYIADYFQPAAYLSGDLRPTIIPVNLHFSKGESHATAIFIQPNENGEGNEAFFFEPHVDAPWSRDLDKILVQLFGETLKKFNITYTSLVMQHCPSALQSALINDYGSCQTWTLLGMLMCARNPDVNKRELFGYLIGLKHNAKLALDLFVYHIYKIFGMGKTLPTLELANKEETISSPIDSFKELQTKLIGEAASQDVIDLLNSVVPKDSWAWRGRFSITAGTDVPEGVKLLLTAIAEQDTPLNIIKLMSTYSLKDYIDAAIFIKAFNKLSNPST